MSESLGQRLTEDKAKKEIQLKDIDGNGQMDFSEFLHSKIEEQNITARKEAMDNMVKWAAEYESQSGPNEKLSRV